MNGLAPVVGKVASRGGEGFARPVPWRFSSGLLVGMLGCALVLAVAATASAQESPSEEPTLFEIDARRQTERFNYGGFSAADSLLPRGRTSRWSVSAGLGYEFSDNTSQNAERVQGTRLTGLFGLGWARRSPRLEGLMDYRLSSDLYQWGGYEDFDQFRQALAGVIGWQAARVFRLDASASATQNLPQGIQGGPPGVTAGYSNRTDEVRASVSYDWQWGRTTLNHAYANALYRNYVDPDAEGEDSQNFGVGTDVSTGVGRRALARGGYDFRSEDELSTDAQRRNHIVTLGMDYTLVSFTAGRQSVLGAVYELDRGLYREGTDYWYQNGRVTYVVQPSVRSEMTSFLGYGWVDSQEDVIDQDWIGGVELDYRFSDNTTGTIGASKTYGYLPSTSRTDFTQLTKANTARASLVSQWTRTTLFSLSADYTDAKTDVRLGPGDEEYWEASGDAELTGGTPDLAFWGLGYRQYRRKTTPGVDDYHAFEGRVFLNRELVKSISGRLSYTHRRRYYDYDAVPGRPDYFENLVRVDVEGQW